MKYLLLILAFLFLGKYVSQFYMRILFYNTNLELFTQYEISKVLMYITFGIVGIVMTIKFKKSVEQENILDDGNNSIC